MTEMRTKDAARELVRAILHELAPEVDLDAADPDGPLGDELDLDSFGFLTLLEMVEERTGTRVPEREYGRVGTISALVEYLAGPPR